MNKRLIILLLFVVFLISGVWWFYSDSRPRNNKLVEVTLRLPIPVADTAFAPYYLAIDKGFFADHGLDVKLEPGTPELTPVKMVSQGIDQFGVVGGPELLFSGRSKGAPIVGIGLVHKDSDFVVVVALKKSGLERLSDLQNKKVGFFYGHISTDILHMLFNKENVKVKEVDVGFDYSSLLSGKLDAQWAFRTTAGISLPAKGVKLNVISPADYGILTQGHMIITNEQMIKEQGEVVQKFMNAVREAMAYSLQHTQEAIDATMRRDPNFKQSVGEKQLEIYNASMSKNSPLGWINEKDMMRTKRQMIDVGLLPRNFDLKSAYTTRFIQNRF
jgi:NitT/TauT family transport system substrate-binding protein